MPTGESSLSYIGYSVDGSTLWQSLASYVATLRVGGGQRKVGEFLSVVDDAPTIAKGRMESYEMTFRLLFTDGTTEPYSKLRGYHLAGSAIYMRWSYNAATANYWKAQGYLRDVPLPDVSSESADPITSEVIFRCATLTAVGVV